MARPYVVEPMGMFLPIVRSIWMKRLYHDTLGGRLLRGASRVIATSEQERHELLDGGIADSKVVVRRNGIEVPAHLPPAGQFRSQWNIPAGSKVVLFLGRLVSKKSPDLMLEAFSQWNRRGNGARGSVLVMAGPDEGDGFGRRLEGLAAQMGLNGNVLFTGPLYGDAKWSAYRDADLFVLPSQNENFGNTAAEAVACGTPVLVTDRCGIAPLVNQRAGLVVPHDRGALEAGLAQILDDPAFAAHLRGGCAGVANSLSWAEPLAQMEALYKELILEMRGQ
jgi:glycosyltransferase involved in cell wall biosynthesis